MFASVYAENVKVLVSLWGERQVRVSLFGERQSSRQFLQNIKVSLSGGRQSSRQLIRRMSKFASVYAENVKVRVSL